MPKEIKEKIIKIIVHHRGDFDDTADQILELFSQREKEILKRCKQSKLKTAEENFKAGQLNKEKKRTK